MKRLRKSPGLSAAKNSKAAWRRALCICAALLLLAVCIVPLILPRQEKIELRPVSGAVDFTDPAIPVHTAADGIAVIRPARITAADETGEPAAAAPSDAPRAGEAAATASGTAAVPSAPVSPTDAMPADTSATYGGFTLPVPMDAGGSVGLLSIPDIGLSVRVYESDDAMEAMSKGIAHFKHTSNWEGNVGFSAHNINLDGSPGYFRDLHTLKKGAVITYKTAQGTRTYTVGSVSEIDETDWSGLARTEDNRLSLITCISGKPAMRLLLTAIETDS